MYATTIFNNAFLFVDIKTCPANMMLFDRTPFLVKGQLLKHSALLHIGQMVFTLSSKFMLIEPLFFVYIGGVTLLAAFAMLYSQSLNYRMISVPGVIG